MLLQGGQLDLAIHHLTLAVELDPNSLDAYLDLGATYWSAASVIMHCQYSIRR